MGALLVVVFLVLPVVEIYVIVQVGQQIGALPTVALLLAMSVVGSWLVKREGLRTWTAFRATLDAGRVPGREIADGALVILGGAFLVTPGFVTDVLGLLLVLPPSRAAIRRAALLAFGRRYVVAGKVGEAGYAAYTARQSRVIDMEGDARPDE